MGCFSIPELETAAALVGYAELLTALSPSHAFIRNYVLSMRKRRLHITAHGSKRWLHPVLVRQTLLCSLCDFVNFTSSVIFLFLMFYIKILFVDRLTIMC